MRWLFRRLVLWALGLNPTQWEYFIMRPVTWDRYREPRYDDFYAPYAPTGKQYWRRERLNNPEALKIAEVAK